MKATRGIKFPAEQRKKVIFWGIGGAVILRIVLTLLTAYLLQITGLRLIGGLLLLYIVYKLYVDVIKGSETEENVKVDNSSFLKAIWTVLIADFTMSLDNVLGVAGAAGDHYGLLVFGLVFAVFPMSLRSTNPMRSPSDFLSFFIKLTTLLTFEDLSILILRFKSLITLIN